MHRPIEAAASGTGSNSANSRSGGRPSSAVIASIAGATYVGFAAWLRDRADLAPERAEALAAVGLGALFSTRLLRLLLAADPVAVDDEQFVRTWVEMVHTQIAG